MASNIFLALASGSNEFEKEIHSIIWEVLEPVFNRHTFYFIEKLDHPQQIEEDNSKDDRKEDQDLATRKSPFQHCIIVTRRKSEQALANGEI
jgi:hypothetical protein